MGIRIPDIRNIDISIAQFFSQYQNQYNYFDMIQRQIVNPKKYELFPIDQLSQLEYSGFRSEEFFCVCANFSLLKNFEYSVMLRELRLSRSLEYIDFEKMIISFTSTAAETLLNYEVYETVGDVILKFITTLFVMEKYSDHDEGGLSIARGNLVSNKNLRNEALKRGFHYYQKQEKKSFEIFVPANYLVDPHYHSKFFKPVSLGKKTIADAVEALIGATFLTQKRFFECFYFMTQMNLVYEVDLSMHQETFFTNVLLSEEQLS